MFVRRATSTGRWRRDADRKWDSWWCTTRWGWPVVRRNRRTLTRGRGSQNRCLLPVAAAAAGNSRKWTRACERRRRASSWSRRRARKCETRSIACSRAWFCVRRAGRRPAATRRAPVPDGRRPSPSTSRRKPTCDRTTSDGRRTTGSATTAAAVCCWVPACRASSCAFGATTGGCRTCRNRRSDSCTVCRRCERVSVSCGPSCWRSVGHSRCTRNGIVSHLHTHAQSATHLSDKNFITCCIKTHTISLLLQCYMSSSSQLTYGTVQETVDHIMLCDVYIFVYISLVMACVLSCYK